MPRKLLLTGVVILFLFVIGIPDVFSWGFFAHKQINRIAVFTLPPDLFGLYKENIEFLTEHAVDPDKRRYAVKGEAERHFIDLDRYGDAPLDSMPHQWNAAVLKYTEDTLLAHGIVPWQIENTARRLSKAFREENLDRILKYSADLGHYVADAHVPLHTTKNYNGQLSNQKGIHAFWESRIPELFFGDYNFFVGKARYIRDINAYAWQVVAESFAAKDSVLLFEEELNSRYPQDKKYSFENRGASLVRVYSQEYTADYHKMLNGMVERRMRAAIIGVGSIWYTAWVNAGQPDLSKLIHKKISEETEKEIADEDKLYKEGHLKGRSCD